MKMRWANRDFKMLKICTIRLQKAYRRYMARSHQVRIRMRSFLGDELSSMDQTMSVEYSQLFGHNTNR